MAQEVAVPAGWYEDPAGRHQYRYWNGARWTDDVADAGTASIDPLGPAGGTDQSSYLQRLKNDFGVDYAEDGWGFEGGKVISDLVDQFSVPEVCWGVLINVRNSVPFDHVCIVSSPTMIAFVVDAPIPVCFITGLDQSGLSAFVTTAVQHGASIEVHEDSPWIITL
jgi:Protein of unknown function (DUF2510)